MAASDILLLTSLQEGLPMVAIEALQWGLAIVSSRIGGMQDIVEEGKNGFLCELTAAEFAERLRELLATSEDAEGNAPGVARKGSPIRS